MKITLQEFGGCFSVRCVAETLPDANVLVRMGMNATKDVRSVTAYANDDGTFSASIVLGKHRKANSYIPRRR